MFELKNSSQQLHLRKISAVFVSCIDKADLQAPLAASAGMDPLVIQMSMSGCIGSASLSESSPYSLATVQN